MTSHANAAIVRVERIGGGIARVVLARPEARNALNLPMCDALRTAFEKLDADDTLRVILLAAEGAVFCAGADLKERTGKDEAWVLMRRRASFAAYDAIARCRKPVIAVVQGAVVGSGGEICMSCDFAIAAETVTFRFPEPQWGTVGATQRLQRVVGKRMAKALLFTGRAMPAAEAHARGLLAEIVPADQLEARALELAEAVASAPPLAMQLTKQAIDLGEEVSLAQGIAVEVAAIEHNLAQGDWRGGIASFSSKIGGGNG